MITFSRPSVHTNVAREAYTRTLRHMRVAFQADPWSKGGLKAANLCYVQDKAKYADCSATEKHAMWEAFTTFERQHHIAFWKSPVKIPFARESRAA